MSIFQLNVNENRLIFFNNFSMDLTQWKSVELPHTALCFVASVSLKKPSNQAVVKL